MAAMQLNSTPVIMWSSVHTILVTVCQFEKLSENVIHQHSAKVNIKKIFVPLNNNSARSVLQASRYDTTKN